MSALLFCGVCEKHFDADGLDLQFVGTAWQSKFMASCPSCGTVTTIA